VKASLLAAAAAIALASLPMTGAQTSLELRAGYSVRRSAPPPQSGRDRRWCLQLAAQKRRTRQARNLRWAENGAFRLVHRS
jgi:hypothetical protein